jgi:transcription initiation factor IIF auxiliary subunit
MPNIVVGVLLWLWFISFPSPIEAQAIPQEKIEALLQEISADNTAKDLGNGRWSWTVFIKAPPEVLQDIQSVQYTLHPTFPYPVQRVNTIGDPKQPFALSATGWGTFPIQIRVFTKDGQTHDLTRNLSFRSPLEPLESPGH